MNNVNATEVVTNNPWTCKAVRGLCACEICRDYRTALHNTIGLRNAEIARQRDNEARGAV
jgi:hypothetical protein